MQRSGNGDVAYLYLRRFVDACALFTQRPLFQGQWKINVGRVHFRSFHLAGSQQKMDKKG
jgi:hypothetical protein